MPELPDVEAIRIYLMPRVVGQTFTGATLNWPRALREPSLEDFLLSLPDQKVAELARRGKYLLFRLDRADTLILHLRMTGSLVVMSSSAELNPFTRTVFHMDNDTQLRFIDPRKLGAIWLVEDERKVIGKLGPEPLEPSFTVEALASALSDRKVPIKALLCEQEVIAGIGNIYADEILFQAGLHPMKSADSLSEKETEGLHRAIQEILSRAIQLLTELLPLESPPTESDEAASILLIPRSKGQSCSACSSPIQRITVRGRGTYFCPKFHGSR